MEPGRQVSCYVGELDRDIKIWDAADYHLLHTVKKVNKGSGRLLFTADSKSLITSSLAGYDRVNRTVLSIIDVATGEVVKNVDGPNDPTTFARANVAFNMALSPDGKLLFVSFNAHNHMAHVYDTSTWADVGSFYIGSVAIRHGNRYAESRPWAGTMRRATQWNTGNSASCLTN